MARVSHSRASASLLLALLLCAGSAFSATRPVSIGVNAAFEHHLALSAHIGWSRIDILWSAVNPQPNVWDFAATDAQINNAVAQGQQILAILHRPPAWVGGGPNENIPPLSTTQWSEFVRRVAQRYVGKIAAYEIWNEPDMKSTSQVGIGWGRNIEEPPLYVDFVRAAAIQIQSEAPGTLVVAPAFLSRNTAHGSNNRKKRILQQIEAAWYPEGSGSSFIDVISAHNNAGDSEGPGNIIGYLAYENLSYVDNHAPSLRQRPVWVTEFGWRSNAVGEGTQRQYICTLVKMNYTAYETLWGWTTMDTWDLRRAFIYVLNNPTTSASIFRPNDTPKLVVTQYLQALPYPVVQNPGAFHDFPDCDGSFFGSSTRPSAGLAALTSGSRSDSASAFSALGLRTPLDVLPQTYSQIY